MRRLRITDVPPLGSSDAKFTDVRNIKIEVPWFYKYLILWKDLASIFSELPLKRVWRAVCTSTVQNIVNEVL
jgi:hypothetical protein